MKSPTVQLYLYFARDNDRAVILRRGPSKTYRMILWHRDTNTFEDGQWVKHKVYQDRCDISPDGRHFLYFMLDGRWESPGCGSYTALSKPPYWTALALFPLGDTWTGGGVFIDSKHYHADGGADLIGRAEGVARVVLGTPDKGCTTGLRLTTGGPAPLERSATKRLLATSKPKDYWALREWMGVPSRRDDEQYHTEEGKLYRRNGTKLDLIRDFTDMVFEPIVAPYDWRDAPNTGGKLPWHPLDGDNA